MVSVTESNFVVTRKQESELVEVLWKTFESYFQGEKRPKTLDDAALALGFEVERDHEDVVERLFVHDMRWGEQVERMLMILLSFASDESWLNVSFDDHEMPDARWRLDEDGEIVRGSLEDEDMESPDVFDAFAGVG